MVDNSASVASVAAPVAATDAKQSMARYHHALKPIFYFDFWYYYLAKNSEATYSITRKCENHYHNRWSNSIEYPYSVNLTPG